MYKFWKIQNFAPFKTLVGSPYLRLYLHHLLPLSEQRRVLSKTESKDNIQQSPNILINIACIYSNCSNLFRSINTWVHLKFFSMHLTTVWFSDFPIKQRTRASWSPSLHRAEHVGGCSPEPVFNIMSIFSVIIARDTDLWRKTFDSWYSNSKDDQIELNWFTIHFNLIWDQYVSWGVTRRILDMQGS